jgi:hypothetical protein
VEQTDMGEFVEGLTADWPHYFMFLGMLAVKEGSLGFGEGLGAGLALVALYSAWCFADLFKVRLYFTVLHFPMIGAGCIWAEIFALDKFLHFVSLWLACSKRTTKHTIEGDYRELRYSFMSSGSSRERR